MAPRLQLKAYPLYPNDAPPLRVGVVTTLPNGAPATAAISGSAPDQTLDLGLPAGPPGVPGAPADPTALNAAVTAASGSATAAAGSASATAALVSGPGLARVSSFVTRTAAATFSIDATISTVVLGGLATLNDAPPAFYRRVGSQPTHAGKFTDAFNAFWELAPLGPRIDVRLFGAKIDGVTDDSAAVRACLVFCSLYNLVTYIPQGVTRIGTIFIPSNATLQGAGKYRTTLKLNDGQAGTALINENFTTHIRDGGGDQNITLCDFTMDGNAPNLTSQIYPMAFHNVQQFKLQRVYILNGYGNQFLLTSGDNDNLGPGGYCLQPQGEYLNFDVLLEEVTSFGYGQVTRNADLNVIGRVDGLEVKNCHFGSGGANCFSFQFCKNFRIHGNTFIDFFSGAYIESCFYGLIYDNDFLSLGTRAGGQDVMFTGIWLASATESYTTVNYQTSGSLDVFSNRFRGLVRGDAGATGLACIRASGRYSDTYGCLDANIHHNLVERCSAAGSQKVWGVLLEGWCESVKVDSNTIRFDTGTNRVGIQIGGSVYATADDMHNISVNDNRIAGPDIGINQQTSSSHVGLAMVANILRGCATPQAIANASQAGYVSVGNSTT